MCIKVWLSILLCISMLAGCSFPTGSSQGLWESNKKGSPELTPDFSDENKAQIPGILINQLGYRPEDNKIAILQGSNLQAEFRIYDAVTKKMALTGTLKEAGAAVYQNDAEETKEGNVLYLADFSGLEKEGSYYLYQEDIGSSDTFLIKEDVYASLEAYLLEQFKEENQDTAGLCYELAGMLLALELYPERIGEPEELQRILAEKIVFLSRAQDQETGGVYEFIEKDAKAEEKNKGEPAEEGETSAVSPEAAAEFAGAMAMYAGYLQNIDQALAGQYQAMAERAYVSIQNSLDKVSYDAGYFAVTQLFRKTGKNKYIQTIGRYLSMEEEEKSYTQYDFSLFGDYGYLSSHYGVNLEWSRQLMNKVMKRAEEISLTSSRERYYISQKREYYEVDGILRDMAVMALVNYIITNHEYSTLQKNYLDYLLGRNPGGFCLVEGFGIRNMPLDQGETAGKENAALFYLLLQSTKQK